MMISREGRRQSAERGITLIVVLLVLVVVTIVGLGAAQIALLAERSTRYDRDYLIASQAAEAALMDAEFDIRGPNAASAKRMDSFSSDKPDLYVVNCGTAGAVRGLCKKDPSTNHEVWETVDFLDNSAAAPTVMFGEFTGRTFDSGTLGVKPAREPRYIVEQVVDKAVAQSAVYKPTSPPAMMYRITAMGFGPRTDIQVVLQIAFRKEQ